MNSQDAVRRENLNSQFEELRLMLTHTGCSVSLSKVCAIIKSVFSIFLPFFYLFASLSLHPESL